MDGIKTLVNDRRRMTADRRIDYVTVVCRPSAVGYEGDKEMVKQKIHWLLLLLLGIMAFAVACSGQGGTEGLEEAADNSNSSPDQDSGADVGDNEANENAANDTADDSLVYEFHREGGIAGFCDLVMVYANGDVIISSCASEPPQEVGSTRLTDEQLAIVRNWVATLASFATEQKDDAVADAMTVGVDFHGNGAGEATAEDIQAMQDLASTLIRQAPTQ